MRRAGQHFSRSRTSEDEEVKKRIVNMLTVLVILIGAVVIYSTLVGPTRVGADEDHRLKLNVVVSSYGTVNPGATGNISVQCPAGEVVVSGGYDTGSSSSSDLSLNDNYFYFRGVTPVGWQTVLTNKDVNPIQFRVYASCTRGF